MIVSLEDDVLNEILHTEAIISGAIITGAQIVAASSGEVFSPRVFIPAQWAAKKICLTTVTINGLYEASGTYLVPADWQGATVPLPYPTRHSDIIQKSGGNELAVRISPNACNEPSSAEFALTLPRSERMGASAVSIMVNSFRAEKVFAYVGDAPEPVLCTPIPSQVRTAFDVTCDLALPAQGQNVKIEVFRIVERKPSTPTSFSVWLPNE